MTKMTFDALLAKREQREADRFRIGVIAVPGTGDVLEVRMPPRKAVLELYAELAAANDAADALVCGNHALYACCPQLQDRKLQEELGVAEDPMGVVDALFTVREQDVMGGRALQFIGVLPPGKTEGAEESDDVSESDTGTETVKN
ncbi:hypothetical protein [uncultured Oscillibacter sp.]|uniref:hypothetical protein n=1 Tax=uncultured Oscillibacter sp. TaxID=876091 RepID=UPI0025F35C1F|nr:hypothetical protein [uncultured Oscillibacter sp.]